MNGMAAIIACALGVGLGALILLLWSIGNGQYEDLDGAAQRILLDDPDDRCSPGQS
jgi:cbb3-type cytochrome oxidase maturation protein